MITDEIASAAVGWVAKVLMASAALLGQGDSVEGPDEDRPNSAYVIADRAMTRC
jgi:hypothetical protein